MYYLADIYVFIYIFSFSYRASSICLQRHPPYYMDKLPQLTTLMYEHINVTLLTILV